IDAQGVGDWPSFGLKERKKNKKQKTSSKIHRNTIEFPSKLSTCEYKRKARKEKSVKSLRVKMQEKREPIKNAENDHFSRSNWQGISHLLEESKLKTNL